MGSTSSRMRPVTRRPRRRRIEAFADPLAAWRGPATSENVLHVDARVLATPVRPDGTGGPDRMAVLEGAPLHADFR